MQAGVTIAPRRSVALFALFAIVMVIVSYTVVVVMAAACVYLLWSAKIPCGQDLGSM